MSHCSDFSVAVHISWLIVMWTVAEVPFFASVVCLETVIAIL